MIDFALSDDEQAVVDAARQVAGSDDPWRGLVDGGWLDLLVDDDEGHGLAFLGLVAEELGAAGVTVPLAGSAAMWPTLFGESAGGRRVGVAHEGLAEDGVDADLLIADGAGYDDFEVQAVGGLDADGLARVVRLGSPMITGTDGSLAVMRATAVTCSEMAGLLRLVFDTTLEHLTTREQFGRTLAAFQVIQHGAARLATLAEGATWIARLFCADPSPEHMHVAKGWVSATAQEASALAHQLHGAIGFTEEYGLQRQTKRLRTLRFAWGTDTEHHTALGRLRSAG